MPCYDPRESGVRTEVKYESGISPDKHAQVLNGNMQMQGYLCAIFNELERRGIVESVLTEASRSGLVGVLDFYVQHKRDDRSRLASELHKYSKDEQEVLRQLLQEQNNG